MEEAQEKEGEKKRNKKWIISGRVEEEREEEDEKVEIQ